VVFQIGTLAGGERRNHCWQGFFKPWRCPILGQQAFLSQTHSWIGFTTSAVPFWDNRGEMICARFAFLKKRLSD
jgi:hypothetical protein